MGLGLWTSEEIKFNETTGEILTMNTWVWITCIKIQDKFCRFMGSIFFTKGNSGIVHTNLCFLHLLKHNLVQEYKPPAAKDIPQDFRVTMLKNARNPMGVLSSKGKF